MKPPDIFGQFDVPAVNARIFFPRPDPGYPPPPGSEDLDVEVEDGVGIALRYHPADPAWPTILHFHGNGEIGPDYDDLVPTFKESGAGLVCADFRGYGRSTGTPSVRALVDDAHPVLDTVLRLLKERGHRGPLVVMGRSLGSAPAIELAASRGSDIAGLIIESGFAQTPDLLQRLGIAAEPHSGPPPHGEDNEDKMARVSVPVLLLHAMHDHIIPPWHAQLNHDRAACASKKLVIIPDADHNTIMMFGGDRYWGSIAEFLAARTP